MTITQTATTLTIGFNTVMIEGTYSSVGAVGGAAAPDRGGDVAIRFLTIAFLAITVPVETIYSWHLGLLQPYYLLKVAGWTLLTVGLVRIRSSVGLGWLVAGWAWLASNFWRAIADRFGLIATSQTLRLGSIEIWFAGSCLLVSLVGLWWALSRLGRLRDPPARRHIGSGSF